LRAFAEMLSGLEVDVTAMRRAAAEGHSTATDLADYLTRRGMPFRDAHEAVARAVRLAASRGVELTELPLSDLRAIAPTVEEDVGRVLSLDGSVGSRDHPGGTAPDQVRRQVAGWRKRLDG
jgi:argininosuccinate lyase